jgi:hypothetical protein
VGSDHDDNLIPTQGEQNDTESNFSLVIVDIEMGEPIMDGRAFSMVGPCPVPVAPEVQEEAQMTYEYGGEQEQWQPTALETIGEPDNESTAEAMAHAQGAYAVQVDDAGTQRDGLMEVDLSMPVYTTKSPRRSPRERKPRFVSLKSDFFVYGTGSSLSPSCLPSAMPLDNFGCSDSDA